VLAARCRPMTLVPMTAKPIDPPSISLPEEIGVDALLLPRKLGEDGMGLYDDSVLTLVKELRAAGATADYQHAADARRWIGEKGVPPVVIDLLVALGGNAGWAALCAVCRSRGSDRMRARVARYRHADSETRWDWFEVEGSGEDVATAIEALEPSADDEPRSDGDSEA
jgi:hypothetical protein